MNKTLLTYLFPSVLISVFSACSSTSDSKETPTHQVNSVTVTDTATQLPASASTDSQDSTWLLIPGKSAGQTKLQESAEVLRTRFGTPDAGDAAMGKAVSTWYSKHDSTGHSLTIYTTQKMGQDASAHIAQIRITSPQFHTQEGIHTGSTLSEIKKQYTVTQTEEFEDADIHYIVYNSSKGISFEADPNGKCIAIIIHEPGDKRPGTYLSVRTTNKYIRQSWYPSQSKEK